MDLINRLKEFMETEARSCSMDLDVSPRCMCIGYGEEQCHSMKLKRHLSFMIDPRSMFQG